MTLDQLAPDKVKRPPFYWQKEGGSFSYGPSGAMTHVED
jgi:hypothetical protein